MDAKNERPQRRVVIGLEPAMLDAAALAAAAQLARSASVELAALFVEDINLLRLAGLPFALEMGAASAARRRMEAADIERALKVQAAQLKRALADAARRLELQWTFEVARGQGLRVLLEWTGASDIVVLAGGAGRPLWQPALEALLRGAYSYERAAPGSVAVALGGGPEALRVLAVAHELARASGAGLLLLIAGKDAHGSDSVQRAEAWLSARGAAARVVVMPDDDPARIGGIVARERAHVLCWPVAGEPGFEVEIATLVTAISCPLIVVK